MHIKIEDQESGAESIICVSRRAKTAEILILVPGHQNLLAQIAQAVGAIELRMNARPSWGDEFLQPYGFQIDSNLTTYVKEL